MLESFEAQVTPLKWNQDVPAVYVIHHVSSGKMYIGSSGRPEYRRQWHMSKLRANKHNNREFQDLFNESDDTYFVYYTAGDREGAYDLEQKLLDHYHPTGRLFNLASDARASNRGRVPTVAQRKHMSEVLKGREFSEEWRAKISRGNKGKVRSEEYRRLRSEQSKGKPLSEENATRLRARAAARSKPVCIDNVVYRSCLLASEALGLSNICVFKRLHNSNFPTWSYVKEEE